MSIYNTDLFDDDEIYGPSTTKQKFHLPSYTFTVVDSLLNIGPIVDSIIDEPVVEESESVCTVDVT